MRRTHHTRSAPRSPTANTGFRLLDADGVVDRGRAGASAGAGGLPPRGRALREAAEDADADPESESGEEARLGVGPRVSIGDVAR